MNVCPSPHPSALFSGNPRGLTEETCFREITGSTAPALLPLEEGDPFQSLHSRCSHTAAGFPGRPSEGQAAAARPERQIPSASSPPPPTGSSVAPQNGARLWGVGQTRRRKRRALSFPTGRASS